MTLATEKPDSTEKKELTGLAKNLEKNFELYAILILVGAWILWGVFSFGSVDMSGWKCVFSCLGLAFLTFVVVGGLTEMGDDHYKTGR